MKASRYLTASLALLISAWVSFPVLATEYPGAALVWNDYGTYTTTVNVPAAGPVTDVSVIIRNAQTQLGFDWNTMLLTSPAGTTITFFDVSLYKIGGTSLYLTHFIDTAPVIITEGVSPYAGGYRPAQSFANFNGQEMNGTWTLAVYNQRSGTANTGTVTDWSLFINQAAPATTPSPTPSGYVCREFQGNEFSWTGVGTVWSDISIPASGTITDVNVNLSASCTASLDPLGMYLVSPEGTIVDLFNKHQLAETTLFLTTFDDSAPQSILGGIAPYIGSYRPVESLSYLNGEWMTGTWTLVAFNDDAGNNGAVSDWNLVICCSGYAATPTPSPTATATPTPVGYLSPSPTPAGYHTPPPTPKACFAVIPPDPELPFTGVGITESKVYIPYNERVEDVDMEVSAWVENPLASSCGTLNFKALYITAPNGVIVKLFGKHDLEEQGLYLTYFDDDAEISILNDIAPYYGPHQPVGLLDKFRQEGTWTRGTWTLSWYNDCPDDLGYIEYFRLCLNRPDLTPSPTGTPPPTAIYTPTATPAGYKTPVPTVTPIAVVCQNFPGTFIEWSGIEVAVGTATISEVGLAQEVWVNIDELWCASNLDSIGMYLIPPGAESFVAMFEKHQLEEHQLYLTTFRNDANRTITSGIAPYIGSFRPIGNLGGLSGVQINGDWQLVVYNDVDPNYGYVTGWDLKICYAAGALRTPTPPPTPLTSPTPPPAGILVLESGDYDGDGTSDIGVFRPSLGLWSVRGVGTSFFGKAGDVPASGDYDGDGTADITVFRGSSGLWAVYGVTRIYYGRSGDTPIPGDYTGDGIADIGIFRGASGLWAVRGRPRIYFGASGDLPVPGDYAGDGSADYAVFRNSSGLWAVRGTTRFYFGGTGDIPLGRDFSGDGTADVGIFRPASGLWAIRGLTRFYFGRPGDYPVGADFQGDWTEYPGIFRPASGLWAIRGVTRVYYGQSGDIPVAR